MQKLDRNWFAEGLLDFEYKQYLLLGYLQGVKQRFEMSLLFPDFQELALHVKDLADFQQNLERIRAGFPKNLNGIDTFTGELKFEDVLPDDGTLKEVEEIAAFARPRLEECAVEGKRLFDVIEENVYIEEVGLMPLSVDAGYLLMRKGSQRSVTAYQYQVTLFEQASERYRGIHLNFISSFSYFPGSTFESIKRELLLTRRELPNPATFSVHSRLEFPEAESILPVTKRKFIRHLGKMGWI